MSSEYTPEQIRAFWSDQANVHGVEASASWSDLRVMEMEVREIERFLCDGDRVLDVGCANGFSTVQFAAARNIDIRGLDYIPAMIDHARQRLATLVGRLCGRVEFDVGDITSLKETKETYDKVISIRVLINLRSWDRQLAALKECARVLKPGGKLLFSEATVQGWQRLNAFRAEWGLPAIPMPPFNEYLDQERLVQELPAQLRLLQVVNFASSYYVGTRVLKPLLIRAVGAPVDAADPNMEWNRWFSTLPACGDYGTQKLFVCERI